MSLTTPDLPEDFECPQCGGAGIYCEEVEDWLSDGRDYGLHYYRYKTLIERTCHHPFHHPEEPIYDGKELVPFEVA